MVMTSVPFGEKGDVLGDGGRAGMTLFCGRALFAISACCHGLFLVSQTYSDGSMG